jgi:hypothetical protein
MNDFFINLLFTMACAIVLALFCSHAIDKHDEQIQNLTKTVAKIEQDLYGDCVQCHIGGVPHETN